MAKECWAATWNQKKLFVVLLILTSLSTSFLLLLAYKLYFDPKPWTWPASYAIQGNRNLMPLKRFRIYKHSELFWSQTDENGPKVIDGDQMPSDTVDNKFNRIHDTVDRGQIMEKNLTTIIKETSLNLNSVWENVTESSVLSTTRAPLFNDASKNGSLIYKRPVIHHLPGMSRENLKWFSIGTSRATLCSWTDNLNAKEKEWAVKALHEQGYDSTDQHTFKSPFIVTPRLYRNAVIEMSFRNKANNKLAARPTKKKVIACYNCPTFIRNPQPFVSYNRDFSACPYSECEFHSSRDRLNESDAVIIFMEKRIGLPPPRPSGQIWISFQIEAPQRYRYPAKYNLWKDQFNWTMNYRLDADIFTPYSVFAWTHTAQPTRDDEYYQMALSKQKSVAWLVSNCGTPSRREAYVKEMQKYIDIDIYGPCGTLECPKSNNSECGEHIQKTYKFYLSFENSFCKDYMTEKMYRWYLPRRYIIPVVRGGFDYDKYMPQNTFINAAHFSTPKDLAMYLNKLGDDPEAYAMMLKEKDKVVCLKRKFDWCDICEKLHTDKSVKTIPDIRQWTHNFVCRKPIEGE
ncbi:alpha-(1,3)-fucosyltransferase fut-6 [Aplysia californica]|uniref:Fucosyltransferase n=1 Tax=Aplysia californica TaxID=6500 RepID=A0ABM0JU61_APLCA|nr:alpha-(1,3)-fucosyltransferase fut-6 [Aplysia californica]